MNRIRKAGIEETVGSGNQESRNWDSRIPFFLVSWLPDFLLIFSCVPIFLIHSASAAPAVIGSKKFTESYVLARNSQARAKRRRNSSGTSPGHGRHDHSLASAARRPNRCLPGIHRDNCPGDFERAITRCRATKFATRSQNLAWE